MTAIHSGVSLLRRWWIASCGALLFLAGSIAVSRLGSPFESSLGMLILALSSIAVFLGPFLLWYNWRLSRSPQAFLLLPIEDSRLVQLSSLGPFLATLMLVTSLGALFLPSAEEFKYAAFYWIIASAIALASTMLVAILTRHFVAKSRIEKLHCPVCDYDLRGVEGSCPECGN